MSELQLPPRRPLPPEVRSRLRTRTLTGIRPRRTRFSNARAPFAVAAGVAVLAAGAMVIGQSVTGGPTGHGKRVTPTTTPSAPRPLDVAKANIELDRCWAAIQAENRSSTYPERSRWRPVSSGDYMWVTVTTAMADGRPIFCQTSVTTVRVSSPTPTPEYIAGSRTAALFMSPEGIIAGIRDPSWPAVAIFAGDGGAANGWTADPLPSGLFVAILRDRIRDGTKLEINRWVRDPERGERPELVPLARPVAPLSHVDRPQPAKDRTSDRGQWVRQCLDNSQSPVVDADMWEPGALVDINGSRYMVLRAGLEFAYCFNDGTRWRFGESVKNVVDFGKNRPQALPGPNLLESTSTDKAFITGALPDWVTKVEIAQGNHPVITADVLNHTYAAQLLELPGRSDIVRAYDATGNKLYEGALN